MFSDILEPDYGTNASPPDPTKIVTFLLYYSQEEMQEFKKLVKVAMKKEYPETFMDTNASDMLLYILKKHYANITNQTTSDRPASGAAVEGQVVR
jgi:hypothetical protein